MSGEDEAILQRVVAQQLRESAGLKLKVASLPDQLATIVQVARVWAAVLQRGNKILFCGNGGSAADCQHLAAELVGRFQAERRPLAGMALTTDTSVLTAVVNDLGYQEVFARQVLAFGRPGDVLVAISTSGESVNVIRAVEEARELKLTTVALTGPRGRLRQIVDYVVSVDSDSIPRIQEAHITIGHIVCGLVEELVFHNQKTLEGRDG